MKSNKNKRHSIRKFFNEKSSRRDFLKWIGFTTVSVTLTACKGPVIKSIPYIVKPEEITLGSPVYYASTMIDSFDIGCVLIKTREGRPIKIEPNSNSKYFNTTSARIQSSLLSIYDEERLKNPFFKGQQSSWKYIDNYIIKYLNKLNNANKKIVLLSHSFPSFSTKNLVEDFKKKFPKTEWIIYDHISYSKALNASKNIFGIRAFPFFDLKNIELIISFDADFLGDWYPESMIQSYARNKNPNQSMIQHIHIESNMSISGANADIRISKKPTEIKQILFELYEVIVLEKPIKNENIYIKKIISSIKKLGKKCVVFSDGDQESYELSFLINKKINSNAIKNNKFILSKESDDEKFYSFVRDLEMNNIGALLVYDTNFIYSLPNSLYNRIIKSIKKIPLIVSFSINRNETSDIADIIAPIPHWLESWGDTNPINNYYTLIQPTIKKIFNTRQFQDSLIIWSKINKKNYYEYLKKEWENNIIPKSNIYSFNEALFHGFIETNENNNYKKHNKKLTKKYYNFNLNSKNFELRLYTKISMGDGYQYNNPWLQEFPDPITRTTWENYLTISYFDAKNNEIKNWNTTDGALNGNCVNIIQNSNIIIENIPVFIQPGQGIGSIGIAFGYGQKKGKLSKLCQGINAYRIYENFNIIQYNIQIEKTQEVHKFSCIQLQNTLFNRNLVKETNLYTFVKYPKKIWNNNEEEEKEKKYFLNKSYSIWEDNDIKKSKTGHHFNLSIDLNKCIGCGSCIIACNSENNIPVVGKEEIRKYRDMHWIRIDRYYSNEHKKNPKVYFQPIMCQHCEHAPCETVCPVSATSHGSQGQNMMAYNRCVGTRYCANNCPYKVRRFNWFNYANNQKFDFNMNNNLGKMVLNPDVVVRSRGVMEKCSLCIQKTQFSIGKAKKENRTVKDEEFETACSISCPTKAITFGDINDKNSEIYKKLKNPRSYKLLDFLGISPNVNYLLKIRNINKK
ncbi:4Fe-4S dicluster domain-containing protein [Blattabacterium cuenoti]|uniref:4Fe-4S dicluster domain-containing protein n=1 Tax=Blattabacterium cuenoti TaxID=1653831 RepID=UPI00163C0660|nr:4Fe-4S dicluster domain-containing protein [Blattabacterium cuenoti]